MKRRLLILCAAIAAAIAVASLGVHAAAAADTGASGGFQGSGFSSGHQNIGFSAQLTANGAVGYVHETLNLPEGLSTLRGKVNCLAVSGNNAAVGYVVLESTGILALSQPVGSTQTLVVSDNPAGDTYGFTSAACAAPAGPAPFPISNGNIIVK